MGTVLLAIVIFINVVIQPWRSGLVASGTSPDGTQCVVTQGWNGLNGGEFYTVRLHSRKPGEQWHWHYIDHEAMRWRNCKMTFSDTGDRLFTVGGDGKRRSFDLAGGTPSQAPPYLPPEMEDRR